MKVSVLICTYNRGSLIRGTLESLFNQTTPPDEIIVVNGGGVRNAEATLRTFSNSKLTVVNVQNRNLSTSRNVGLGMCTGDVIAQTDDDAIVDKDWVKKIRDYHLKHPSIGGIGGEVVDFKGTGITNRLADLMTFVKYDQIRKVRTLPGVNVSYKKEAILRVGEYDENLERGEDVDFNWRMLCEGFDLLYVPSMIVLHKHRSSFRGIFNQQYMYGRSYYRIRLKWPEMYNPYPVNKREALRISKSIHLLVQPLLIPFQRIKSHKFSMSNVLVYPLLFAAQIAWTLGYLREFLDENKR